MATQQNTGTWDSFPPQCLGNGGQVSPPQTARVYSMPMGIEKAFAVLADNLKGFEKRPEQYQLASTISASIRKGQHLVAEAPTGTGKSFAVALAVIAEYLGSDKRAIIATANNNLLEQYASKDLPFLQSIFPSLRWARAKGKNNYACIDKAEKLFGQQMLFDQKDMKKLQQWYDSTEAGDKEEITFSVAEKDWAQINADDTCTGRKCPFYEDCHYYKAKEALYKAQIIVTNFDLVLLEAFNPMIELFPRYDALIFDEAHQLEDKAISKLEKSLTEKQVLNYIKKAQREFGVDEMFGQSVALKTVSLFNAYRDLLASGEEKKSVVPSEKLREKTSDFSFAMTSLQAEVSRYKTESGGRQRKAQENLMNQILNVAEAAHAVTTNDKKTVSWVEQTKSDIKVVNCPFRVAQELYKNLFSDESLAVVTMSATLSAGGGKPQFTATQAGVKPAIVFEQFRQKVGLMAAGEFVCPSPFNYKSNCGLYLPTPPEGVMTPNCEEWRLWMRDQILELVRLSNGKAFVLTTSTKATREIGDFLSKETGLPVKSQSPDMSNSKMIEWFKSTPNSVIVATSSFWEGVSVEGDDLKLVIIDKIPFTPHTEPIQQAKEAWYKADPDRKNRAFMDLQLYPAIIRLKQGFGRLIRTKSDSGVVALLDPRLTKARYRNTILNSLPNAQRITSLSDSRLHRLLEVQSGEMGG